MLTMVLLIVLAAAGVLGAAVAMATPQLGWVSLALTLLAGALLALDSRRRKVRSRSTADGSHTTGRHHRLGDSEASTAGVNQREPSAPARFGAIPETGIAGLSGRSSGSAGGTATAAELRTTGAPLGAAVQEPASQEQSAAGGPVDWFAPVAADAGAVGASAVGAVDPDPDVEQANLGTATRAELNTEIRVVDERPRYHLPDCGWLAKQTAAEPLPLLLRQAQVLGFTPCAHCAPNMSLARRFRGDKF